MASRFALGDVGGEGRQPAPTAHPSRNPMQLFKTEEKFDDTHP